MDTTNLQLSPEQRQALQAHPGEPLHIQDEKTRKVYVLVEQGAIPELEEEYIRQGLEMARDQIARGEVSETSIVEVIDKAQRLQTAKS
jgi:hypothetical protein